ncbi:hypothetical protein EXU85_16270 [Spirosoma sp. KCTC 42546]|uniref:hypothetical protein n=1 Tax=Spirosoma sp. KCTC 42546 TaxID=2520506 RepID=UPI00115A1430|nr:hypothetical protein [Spirosoma sp. KCTC 42546]QDK80079.1 hypothetical protein EXU85_16270 [Spirosoma sp. KCTC 42546]
MFRCILLLLFTTAILTSCSSGKSALNRNHFDLAVQKASKRLQQRPGLSKRGHTMASQVLEQAFVQAYEQHQTAIRRLSAPSSTEAFRWERVYQEYEQLQALTDNARRGFDRRGFDQQCETCAEWLSAYPSSYQDRQQATRELAAADRYQVAEQAFAYRQENRLAAKDAYLNFRKAADWIPNYQQANAKAAESLPFAILRVVVEPLSPTPELSADDNRELERLILQQLGRNTTPSQFVRLYHPGVDSPGESTLGDGYPIHQAIQLVVTNYSPFRESNSSSSTTVYSHQEYKVGEKKINDSTKVDVKEKVSGTLTTYRHEIQAGLDLRMRALDTQTGNILWEEPVWESRSWQSEWQSFSGDDRALNGQSLKTATPFPPSRWQLLDSMRDELAGDVVRRLLSKYKND